MAELLRWGEVVYLSQIFQLDKKDSDAVADGALHFILSCASAEGCEALTQGNLEGEYLDSIWSDIKKVQQPE